MNHSAAKAIPLPDTVIPVERGTLRRKLAQVRMQLACAEDLFNCATDEAVMDSSIYQLKSLQVYYSFLMRQLRLEEGGDGGKEQAAVLPDIPEGEAPVLPELCRGEVAQTMG